MLDTFGTANRLPQSIMKKSSSAAKTSKTAQKHAKHQINRTQDKILNSDIYNDILQCKSNIELFNSEFLFAWEEFQLFIQSDFSSIDMLILSRNYALIFLYCYFNPGNISSHSQKFKQRSNSLTSRSVVDSYVISDKLKLYKLLNQSAFGRRKAISVRVKDTLRKLICFKLLEIRPKPISLKVL